MYFFDLVDYTHTTGVSGCKNSGGTEFIGFIFKTDGTIKGFTASNVQSSSQYNRFGTYRPYLGAYTRYGTRFSQTNMTPTYSGDALTQICCINLKQKYPNYNIQWINNECRWIAPCGMDPKAFETT